MFFFYPLVPFGMNSVCMAAAKFDLTWQFPGVGRF
jgi:hypothetical protein